MFDIFLGCLWLLAGALLAQNRKVYYNNTYILIYWIECVIFLGK